MANVLNVDPLWLRTLLNHLGDGKLNVDLNHNAAFLLNHLGDGKRPYG